MSDGMSEHGDTAHAAPAPASSTVTGSGCVLQPGLTGPEHADVTSNAKTTVLMSDSVRRSRRDVKVEVLAPGRARWYRRAMGIPPNIRHVIFVVIIVAGAGVHALLPLEPAWSWLITAASLLAALGAVFTDAPGTAARLAAARATKQVGTAAGIFCIAMSARCSWLTSPQGAASEKAAVDLAVCILNHVSEPPTQIATDCGASAVGDVIAILDAHNAAMVRADAGAP